MNNPHLQQLIDRPTTSIEEWTLQDDNMILNSIISATNIIEERLKQASSTLDDLVHNVTNASTKVKLLENQLQLLGDEHFVENRVYDDDDSKIIAARKARMIESEVKSKTTNVQNLPLLKSAIRRGLAFVEQEKEAIADIDHSLPLLIHSSEFHRQVYLLEVQRAAKQRQLEEEYRKKQLEVNLEFLQTETDQKIPVAPPIPSPIEIETENHDVTPTSTHTSDSGGLAHHQTADGDQHKALTVQEELARRFQLRQDNSDQNRESQSHQFSNTEEKDSINIEEKTVVAKKLLDENVDNADEGSDLLPSESANIQYDFKEQLNSIIKQQQRSSQEQNHKPKAAVRQIVKGKSPSPQALPKPKPKAFIFESEDDDDQLFAVVDEKPKQVLPTSIAPVNASESRKKSETASKQISDLMPQTIIKQPNLTSVIKDRPAGPAGRRPPTRQLRNTTCQSKSTTPEESVNDKIMEQPSSLLNAMQIEPKSNEVNESIIANKEETPITAQIAPSSSPKQTKKKFADLFDSNSDDDLFAIKRKTSLESSKVEKKTEPVKPVQQSNTIKTGEIQVPVFSGKKKALFESDSEDDDLFTFTKQRRPLITAENSVKVAEPETKSILHAQKNLVKKRTLFDSDSDDDLFK